MESVPLGPLAIIPGTTITLTLDRAGTISVQGNVNVFTDRDALIWIYLNEIPIGVPGYTSVTKAWVNIPLFAMRNVQPGTYVITLRGDANGSSARAGTRVLTATAF